AGGDVVKFVQETEQLDFAGAIEWLAERFNVPIEYEESSPQQDEARRRRERLYALLDQAATFSERYLWESQAGSLARDYLAGRGLGEEVCRAFRLGLALGGATLSAKAREKGFTPDELRRAGLVTQRGTDYFSRRLVFPLADARGRVVGFQARKLYEDDPLRGKYVNTPEGELFHKGSILYGLDKARAAIAKGDRAVVVEGNTDVIALRQAGFEHVVASMGTALTDQQLKELARLTRRVWLCFDGDAAGEAATLRGMELAVAMGLDVKVVALPPGIDPADDPASFESGLAAAEPYALYRVRIEIERAPDAQAAYLRVKEILDRVPDSPERQEAWRHANDRLGMTVQIQRGVTATTGSGAQMSPKLLEAGERLERDVLAGCIAHPQLVRMLAELAPEHFDSELNRRVRAVIVGEGADDAETVALRAELDARADREGIDEETGKELLLRLRERRLRQELRETDDLERTRELQVQLARIRQAVGGLT
ncbi:MAG TPA: toprim domain-containing protein, partial [Gaiellaceae bacterium]|nr:toprim domain-containing protein [Gaiellaceae bacterium]